VAIVKLGHLRSPTFGQAGCDDNNPFHTKRMHQSRCLWTSAAFSVRKWHRTARKTSASVLLNRGCPGPPRRRNMGTFQADPSMMDPFNLSSSMLDPSLVTPMDISAMSAMSAMSTFQEDVQMELGPVTPASFNPMAPRLGGPVHDVLMENGQRSEVSENNPTSGTSAVGAGPLPTGFGAQSIAGGASTLTEFTKRRNWSQRVLEELKDLLYILTPDSRLLYVSPSAKALTGYEPRELTGKFIIDFIHSDDQTLFMREFNESIATGHPLRFFYRFRHAEKDYVIFECHGHPHLTNDIPHMEMSGGPGSAAGVCRGFFMMARPYPTKNAELLDSFLEHKIENVRLQARIAALKREEAEEAEAQAQYHKQANGQGSRTPSIGADVTPQSPSLTSRGGESSDFSNMPPPAKPTVSNIALTREALDEANAFARSDSMTDKMDRYQGSSHVDSIEMLTGLRYREGERSHGISTGGASPALIRGDAGIDIPVDKTESRYGASYLDKKPKKVKGADEYVCTDCGTLDSPEWRKGPNGPKTLCNACGLRWAKKEKKKSGSANDGQGNGGNGGHQGNGTPNGNSATEQGAANVPVSKQNISVGASG